MNKNCPTQNNFQHFLAGETSSNERNMLEIHLADCADCRQNLALMFSENTAETEVFETPKSLIETVKNLPAKEKKSASFFSFGWLKIAFASALVFGMAFIGIYVLQNRQTFDSGEVMRNGAINKTVVKLLAPENSTNLQSEKIEFRWTETQNAKSYTLVLSDEKGDIIKEFKTEKTQIETSISALGLTHNKSYFWHVKAKLADGLTSESETRKILAK
ncbi:MAG TPA: zf-HC2 domain-containing protein [Pyrinomonadaceae bacterium]|nr:zf-HC2 domain-containing protein [Pyrinomonadaceae bacterium]